MSMKKVTIDFTNNIIRISARSYQETKKLSSLDKDFIASFFPSKKYLEDYNSYTWNFDLNTFVVNQEQKIDASADADSIKFLPELIVPMPKLSRKYKEFMNLILSA